VDDCDGVELHEFVWDVKNADLGSVGTVTLRISI
jgi:hypothetical protein